MLTYMTVPLLCFIGALLAFGVAFKWYVPVVFELGIIFLLMSGCFTYQAHQSAKYGVDMVNGCSTLAGTPCYCPSGKDCVNPTTGKRVEE